MRSSSARVVFSFIATIITVTATAAPAAPDRFDRTAARELARIDVRDATPVLAPRLRAEGVIETLEQPIALPASERAVRIVVERASSVRLLVTGAAKDAVLWVADEDDPTFERFEPGATATWTPTTTGSVVYIASENGGDRMMITQLSFASAPAKSSGSVCLMDAPCTGQSEELRIASRAVAMLRFVRGGASYVCTGSLLRDRANSGTPYMLTAQHCISTPEEAASIEVVWDHRTASCGPDVSERRTVRTYGAELLVASADTDVALLRLNKLPPDRQFLSVELSPLTEGSPTYRLSHADGAPLTYSAGMVRTSGGSCDAAPRPRFLYTSALSGAVTSGSSGAPLLLPGLRVAGQLLGVCGPAPADACASANDRVDGSLAASWPLLAPFLDAPATTRRRRAAY